MTSIRLRLLQTTAALLFLSLAVAAHAQFSGTVQGTVVDSSGAVIPGAAVTLRNAATGAENTFTTSSSGTYTFPSLPPGHYQVIVEAAGFARTTTDVRLDTAEVRGVNVTLHPQGAQTQVNVTATAAALNPEETRVQTTLTNEEIKNLPLPNRDTTLLLQLAPGATGYVDEGNGGGYGSNIFGAGVYQPGNNNSSIGTSINGSGLPGASNLFLIDDLPVMSTTSKGSVTILPNPDMIDQVSLQTQTFSVENGESSSIQTAFTTKSGSNAFHGSADFTYTGRFLTANQVFAPTNAGFHRQNFIGSLGGPVWKNHTFFFGSVQLLRSAGAGGSLDTWISPEAAAWAHGAFPSANGPKMLLLAPPTRVFNGVPEYASTLYPYTPASGTTAESGCGTAADSFIPCDLPVLENGEQVQQNPYNGTQWNARLDQIFRGGNDRLYGQYIHLDQSQGFLSDRGYFDGTSPSDNWYWSVNYVRVFNPRLVNEAHFGAARSWNSSQYNNFEAYSAPVQPIIFSGGTVNTNFLGAVSREHTYNFRDTVSWNFGAHSLRFGYQFFRGDSVTDDSALYSRPFIPFFTDPLPFFQDYANAGVGYYSIGGNGLYTPQVYGSKIAWNGIFVEDQYKLRPNLTLTLGIRYDNFGNPSKYGTDAGNFYPLFLGSGTTQLDQVIGVSTKLGTHAFAGSQNMNFQPRAGFAWTPARDHNRLLLRGGMGLFEDSVTPSQVAVNLPTNPPNRITFTPTINNPNLKGFLDPLPYGDFKTTIAPFGIVYPPVPTYGTDPYGNVYSNPEKTAVYPSGLNGYDRNLKVQKILKYSLGMEIQGSAQTVYSVSYVGSYAYDLYYGGDWNLLPGDLLIHNGTQERRTSEWGQIEYNTNGLSSNYNGLIFALRQNYKNLFWQASYTWSHALQDAPNAGQANSSTTQLFSEVYTPKQYYGSSAFDRTNVFSLVAAYQIPKLTSRAWVNEVTNWRLGTIVTAQSGAPFTVVNSAPFTVPSASDPLGGGYMADGSSFGIPTYNGHHHGGWSRSLARTGVFDKDVDFSAPANFPFEPGEGNQGASTFRNPGYFVVDANLSKAFSLPWFHGEHSTFLLRGEASNLLNRANLGPLGNDTNAQYFGQSSAGGYPRFLQIGGRFEF